MYGRGAGGALATTSALALPNTGGNVLLTVISLVSFLLGATLVITATAKVMAERRFTEAK